MQKDSKLRRQLSDKGKECFLNGEWDKVLDFYNEAALFSTAKGMGHTLARRAAYLLQTDELDLAFRDVDLSTAPQTNLTRIFTSRAFRLLHGGVTSHTHPFASFDIFCFN